MALSVISILGFIAEINIQGSRESGNIHLHRNIVMRERLEKFIERLGTINEVCVNET